MTTKSERRRGRARRRRARLGDDYLDLVEAFQRGALAGDGCLEPGGLRAQYVVRLASWEGMIGELLEQLATDAGSVRAALVELGVPRLELIDAWETDPLKGTTETAMWLAGRLSRPRGLVLSARDRLRRGDAYTDMKDALESGALAGGGVLDTARLRANYALERGPWLGMVGDLLAQVVGDSGSLERGATVLAVPVSLLGGWVRWLVSRGCAAAAASRWPVAPAGDEPNFAAYEDLIEATDRGMVDGDNSTEAGGVCESYVVELDSWERMIADLRAQIIADAGSIRRASKVIDVPRSTLGAWVSGKRRRARS